MYISRFIHVHGWVAAIALAIMLKDRIVHQLITWPAFPDQLRPPLLMFSQEWDRALLAIAGYSLSYAGKGLVALWTIALCAAGYILRFQDAIGYAAHQHLPPTPAMWVMNGLEYIARLEDSLCWILVLIRRWYKVVSWFLYFLDILATMYLGPQVVWTFKLTVIVAMVSLATSVVRWATWMRRFF